jgi:hypothetical protein
VRIVGSGEEVTSGQIPFTPRAKKVLELALREALSLGHNYIGTEHILLGLVRENEGVAARILLDFDADSEKIRNEVIRMLSGPGRAARAGGAGGARARARSPRSCSTSSAATSPSSPPRASSTRSSARDRDRADHADPLAPHEEQPGARRRAGRRQDRRGRGPRQRITNGEVPGAAARTSRSTRSTWPRSSRARSTAASSRSASRR